MDATMKISEARAKFLDLPDSLEKSQDVLQVTRRGKPVLAVLPWEIYELARKLIRLGLAEPPAVYRAKARRKKRPRKAAGR